MTCNEDIRQTFLDTILRACCGSAILDGSDVDVIGALRFHCEADEERSTNVAPARSLQHCCAPFGRAAHRSVDVNVCNVRLLRVDVRDFRQL